MRTQIPTTVRTSRASEDGIGEVPITVSPAALLAEEIVVIGPVPLLVDSAELLADIPAVTVVVEVSVTVEGLPLLDVELPASMVVVTVEITMVV